MSSRTMLHLGALCLSLSLTAAGQVLPKGTRVFVRLNDNLSSEAAKIGDSFEATLDRSVEVRGSVVVPEGARVCGIVTAVEATEGQRKPGTLTIELSSIEAEKVSYALSTTTVTRWGKERANNSPKPGPATVAGDVIDVLAAGKHAPLDTPPGEGSAQVGGKGGLEAIIPAQLVLEFKTKREAKPVPH